MPRQLKPVSPEFKNKLNDNFDVEADLNKLLDRAISEARLGFGCASFIFDDNINWGAYNNRKNETDHSALIAFSYIYDGYYHEKPIIIGVKQSWLKNPEAAISHYSVSKSLPLLELNDEGKDALAKKAIIAYTGRHRVGARQYAFDRATKILGPPGSPKKLSSSSNIREVKLHTRVRAEGKSFPVEVILIGKHNSKYPFLTLFFSHDAHGYTGSAQI